MLSESLMAFRTVGADPDDLRAGLPKILVRIAERASLGGATAGFVLGVEIDDRWAALQQLGEPVHLAALVWKSEIGCLLSFSNHADVPVVARISTAVEAHAARMLCWGRSATGGAVLYRYLVRPLLYLLPAEAAHHVVISLLRFVQFVPGLVTVLSWIFRRPADAGVHVMGMEFPSRVGLAAGFDKDATVFTALGALGFGFVEVGTITGEAQPGNEKPRLFRLPRDRALINRMGFNNRGAENAAARLVRRGTRDQRPRKPGEPALGINIGKTKKVASEDAPADYEKSARLLAPYADYFVVNVSSPNTPGLRDLQAVDSLRPLLDTVRRALDQTVPHRRVPLLVKIAPDLSDEDITSVGRLALSMGLDGIIATNTTIARQGLSTPAEEVERMGAGGLSGAPLKQRALDVIRLLRTVVGDRITLIAAGGIETAEDAWARLEAGAALLQVYTPLIYQGPSLPTRLCRELQPKLKLAAERGSPRRERIS